MKVAVIALASAGLIGFAQPGLAQQNTNRDQSDRMDRPQYSSGMHRQFQNNDERSDTSGQGSNWSDRNDWRDRNGSDDRDRERMHRWSMHGNMQGRMGAMWRMHEHANANEAAHFRFRRGQAAIDVQCPQGEALQACVDAAGQLLDKIANLRDRNAQGATSGMGFGSEDSSQMSPQPDGSSANQEFNRPRRSRSQSGR